MSLNLLESLEPRALFDVTPDPGSTFDTAFNIGDVNGQQTINESLKIGDFTDIYKFSMARDGMFFGRLCATANPTEITLFDANHQLLDSRIATQTGSDGGFSSGDLPGRSLKAGDYFIDINAVGGTTPYLVRFTADYAGNTLKTARDVGTVTDGIFRDFVGSSDSPSLTDMIDVYKIKMEAFGVLTPQVTLDIADPNNFKAHVEVIQDSNNDGAIGTGETLFHGAPAAVTNGSVELPAGTYFVRVVNDLNFSNYRLHLNADYAGSTPGTTRDMGSLDKIKTFNDFISSTTDQLDQYKFSVGSIRPLFLVLSDSDDDGVVALTLFNDTNKNGVADPSERVIASLNNHFDDIVTTIGPGNYIVQVQAKSAGEGTYQLSAETRPDGAGNTLKTAKNLGAINGLTHLDDYVSDTDPFDFYKFTAAASGTIGASIFCDFANADLSLIRDANNNGVVDKGDVLATGQITPMSQVKEFTANISAGTYFLRAAFNDIEGTTSKYNVSFQTDYAGSTPKTARNVGALAGTKNFDDWSSGPFTGAISDTSDLYKFTLGSKKTFSAKMIGKLSGQDLDLVLYQDKNKDGVLSNGEIIARSRKLDSPNEQISKSLAAGTYYVQVLGINGETNYHLTLKA